MTFTPPQIATADTPVKPPATLLDRVKGFAGDLARPYAIIVVASALGWAIARAGADAGVITAAGGVLVLLYGAKSAENAVQATQTAKVAISANSGASS